MSCAGVKRVVRSFFENSNFHCYHYLVDKGLHWSERMFWFLCLVAASATGVWLMLRSIAENQSQPISLTVDTLYLHWKNVYPAVVFCEYSRDLESHDVAPYFNTSDYKALQILRELIFYTGDVSMGQGCRDPAFAEDNCLMKHSFAMYARLLRKKCGEMFVRCSWEGRDFDCCEKFLPMQTIWGECYAFNSMSSDPPTKKFAYFTSRDLPKLRVDTSTHFLSISVLSAEDILSYRETQYGSIFDGYSKKAKRDSEYDIIFKFKDISNDVRVKGIPIEIRKCRFPDENNLILSKQYSYPACVIDILAKLQMKSCGCLQIFLPINGKEEDKCNNMSQILCLANSHGINVAEAGRLGALHCDISCIETEVNPLANLKSNLETSDNITAARFNFYATVPTLRYHRKVVRDVVDITVNVGGIGTLFFGASILSIIEIIYLFCMYPCGAKQKVVPVEKIMKPAVIATLSTPVIPVFDERSYTTFKTQRPDVMKRKPFPYRN